MSVVRFKKDGTRVTTPAWVTLAAGLLGMALVAMLLLAFEIARGVDLLALVAATICLGAIGVRLLQRCEKRERVERLTFGGAKFSSERSEAQRAGLGDN
jgi:hypothetical protein